MLKPMRLLTEVYLKDNQCIDKDFLNDFEIMEIALDSCHLENRVKNSFNEINWRKYQMIELHPVSWILFILGCLVILIFMLLIILCIVGIYRRTCKRNRSHEYDY